MVNTPQKILNITAEIMESVRKDVNLEKPGRMEEAIDILQKWIAKQDHYTMREFPREYLERLLVSNKGLIERTKQKIDHICTYRTLMPDFFKPATKEELTSLLKVTYTTYLTKMTKDNHRIYIYKAFDGIEDKDISTYFKYMVMCFEYLNRYDYQSGTVVILDYRDVNILNFIPKIPFPLVKQLFTIATEGYSYRIKSINFISSSKTVNAIISLFKQILSAKLASRIRLHKTIDTLYEIAPREILPKDFGGQEKSLKELNEMWIDVLTAPDFNEYLQNMNQCKTDETIRQSGQFNENYIGTPGSFRFLSVD